MAQPIQCGLHRLECEVGALPSEGAADESGMGGQQQDADFIARGRAVGQGGRDLRDDAVLWATGIPWERPMVACPELVWHVQSIGVASALYAAARGGPCLREPSELAV